MPLTPAPPTAPHDLGGLFRRTARPLERLVGARLPADDRGGVEDACQTAWARMLLMADGREATSAFAWLLTTAQREARRQNRRAARETSLEALMDTRGDGSLAAGLVTSGTPSDPHDCVVARERIGRLRSLPERQRRILWLRAAGYSYEEISARTGCTLRTVERQLARARHRIAVADGL